MGKSDGREQESVIHLNEKVLGKLGINPDTWSKGESILSSQIDRQRNLEQIQAQSSRIAKQVLLHGVVEDDMYNYILPGPNGRDIRISVGTNFNIVHNPNGSYALGLSLAPVDKRGRNPQIPGFTMLIDSGVLSELEMRKSQSDRQILVENTDSSPSGHERNKALLFGASLLKFVSDSLEKSLAGKSPSNKVVALGDSPLNVVS